VARADRLGGLLQAGDRPLCQRGNALASLDPRAQPLRLQRAFTLLPRCALGHPPLGGDLGLDARALDGGRALVRCLAAALDQPLRAADALARLLGLAKRLAQRAVGALERLLGLLEDEEES
jgi:hypothetical protein